MKIEIAESLFYSWLRHVKSCQIVQTNWKLSKCWEVNEELRNNLERLMKELDGFFYGKYKYQIFKQNASLDQLLNQGECDALGLRLSEDNQYNCYAVDVAFHENGLKYGEKDVTVSKVVEKCVRTAFCLYGYLNTSRAEILFASPKIYPAVLEPLDKCMDDLNNFFSEKGLSFNFSLIANDDFNENVIKPTLMASEEIADTTELFVRSYKLLSMFGGHEKNENREIESEVSIVQAKNNLTKENNNVWNDEYKGLKIGEIAQTKLKPLLESGKLPDQEIMNLCDAAYSKKVFGLQFPLLVKDGINYEKKRYYSDRVRIKGKYYYMCSQWYERPANNDRPLLLKWLRKYK